MQSPRFWQRPIFYYLGLVSLSLWLTRLFHFVLLEWLTIFVLPLLWLLLLILVLVGVVWAIVWWVRSPKPAEVKSVWQRRWLPLALWAGAIGLTIGVPFEKLWLTSNFYWHRQAREQVIQLAQTNQLPPSSNPRSVSMWGLPAAYRQTSMGGGEVEVFSRNGGLYVLFFTMRTYGGADGFVYSEAGAPVPVDGFGGYKVVDQELIEPHWYYVKIGD